MDIITEKSARINILKADETSRIDHGVSRLKTISNNPVWLKTVTRKSVYDIKGNRQNELIKCR